MTKTVCDGCGKEQDTGFLTALDWATCLASDVDEGTDGNLRLIDNERGTFCPDCWEKMLKVVKK